MRGNAWFVVSSKRRPKKLSPLAYEKRRFPEIGVPLVIIHLDRIFSMNHHFGYSHLFMEPPDSVLQYVSLSELLTRPLATVWTRPPHTFPSHSHHRKTSHVQAQRCTTTVAKATMLMVHRSCPHYHPHCSWLMHPFALVKFSPYPWMWGVALDNHVRNGIVFGMYYWYTIDNTLSQPIVDGLPLEISHEFPMCCRWFPMFSLL